MKSFSLLAVVLLWLSLPALILNGQSKDNAEPLTTKFTLLKGKVHDTSGKPLEKFKVTIKLEDYSDSLDHLSDIKLIARWEKEFESGEFEFKVDRKFELHDNIWMGLNVVAEGYATPGTKWFEKTQLKSFDGDLGTKQLKRGIKVHGTLRLPSSSGDTKIKHGEISVSDLAGFFQDTAIDEDGSFSLVVPEDCEIEFAASADNGAQLTKKITIPKFAEGAEKDLGQLVFPEGIKARGKVLGVDGNPAEGQVVLMWHMGGIKSAATVAITDEQGQFELAPRLGKCEMALVDKFKIGERLFKRTGKEVFAKSVQIELEAGKTHKPIEIRALRKHKVTGSIKLPDGTPASKVTFSVSYEYVNDIVKADSNGNFKVELPEEVDIQIHLDTREHDDTGNSVSRLTTSTLKKFRKNFKGRPHRPSNWYELTAITGDIGPLDFEIVTSEPDQRTVTERIWDRVIWGDD